MKAVHQTVNFEIKRGYCNFWRVINHLTNNYFEQPTNQPESGATTEQLLLLNQVRRQREVQQHLLSSAGRKKRLNLELISNES